MMNYTVRYGSTGSGFSSGGGGQCIFNVLVIFVSSVKVHLKSYFNF